jgi:hypothetical protein
MSSLRNTQFDGETETYSRRQECGSVLCLRKHFESAYGTAMVQESGIYD